MESGSCQGHRESHLRFAFVEYLEKDTVPKRARGWLYHYERHVFIRSIQFKMEFF